MVGLLYSGEVETSGSLEKDEVLNAAQQFGMTDLVEGQKDAWVEEREPQRQKNGEKAADCPLLRTPCVSLGTQSVDTEEEMTDVPLRRSATDPSSPSGAPVDGDSDGVRSAVVRSDDPESQKQFCHQRLTEPEEGLTGSVTPPSHTGAAEENSEHTEEPQPEGNWAQTLTTTQIYFKVNLLMHT